MVVELAVGKALAKLAVLVVAGDAEEYAKPEAVVCLGLLGICGTRSQCNEYGGLEYLELQVEVLKQRFGQTSLMVEVKA